MLKEITLQDWQLYNRVGATLANGGQAADALQYYYRALELNPSYIRARFVIFYFISHIS
jgi:Flp pilus assembly protein TadD